VQKIGIYGGTFDPVHHAHLILAREACEKFQLEKIIFVPAAASPQKQAPAAPAAARLQMLQAAIDRTMPFEVDDCELRRPAPSYTIDTMEEFVRRYRGNQFYYLIGDDNVGSLPTWRRFQDLQKIVTFLVLRRAENPVPHEYLSVERRIDISSTEIRNRVATGRPISYLVPQTVEEIIRAQSLYREVSK
jgi:nicotinate-nucleotide adenylyltransferase